MKGIQEAGALAATNLFGREVGSMFTLMIACLLLSTMSAMIMTGPRVYFAMAQDGVFLTNLAKLHQYRRTPTRAILLQSLVATVMAVTSTFGTLLVYIGYLLAIFSSITVLGLVRLRITQPDRARPYRTWGYPATPLLFVGINIWIVVYSVRSNLTAFFLGVLTLVLGVGFFECFRATGRRV